MYIHIPFCTQKCIYCDFLSGTNLSLRGQFIDALIAEMDCYLDFFREDKIRTIYFGGGTPSLLSVEELARIYRAIAERWDVSEVEEFTIECNPDDLSEEYLTALNAQCTMYNAECKMHNAQLLTPSASLVPLRQGDNNGGLPINRLSIGVQSFVDDELKWLNRRHTANEAFEAVQRAKRAGFKNITIDLMFALPVQTIESLNYSIDKALELDVQHISAYSLMFEPDSKITKLMEMNRLKPLDEDVAADMFDLLSKRLSEAGYEQYEISNYAKKGFESRHNSGYWHGMRYLGLGPSAHSFDGEKRWSNVAHTIKYNAQLLTPSASLVPLRQGDNNVVDQIASGEQGEINEVLGVRNEDLLTPTASLVPLRQGDNNVVDQIASGEQGEINEELGVRNEELLTLSASLAQLKHGDNSWVNTIRTVEVLTEDERFNELVFTALRTKVGVDLVDLRIRFGDVRCDRLLLQAQKYVNAGNMQIINNRLSLTHRGIYISDSIISDFMIV